MIKFSHFKENLLATAAFDGSVNIWDVTQRQIVTSFPTAHSTTVSSVCFSTGNPLLLCSAGLDKNINFYDVQDKKIVKTLKCDQPLSSLAFYKDAHTICVGT